MRVSCFLSFEKILLERYLVVTRLPYQYGSFPQLSSLPIHAPASRYAATTQDITTDSRIHTLTPKHHVTGPYHHEAQSATNNSHHNLLHR